MDAKSKASQTSLVSLLPVMTIDELAELLRINRKTAYAMVQRREIPGVRRVGRTLRVHRDTVMKWLSEGQGETAKKGSK